MRKLDVLEMQEVNGGINWVVVSVVTGVVSFVIGVIDGLFNSKS